MGGRQAPKEKFFFHLDRCPWQSGTGKGGSHPDVSWLVLAILWIAGMGRRLTPQPGCVAWPRTSTSACSSPVRRARDDLTIHTPTEMTTAARIILFCPWEFTWSPVGWPGRFVACPWQTWWNIRVRLFPFFHVPRRDRRIFTCPESRGADRDSFRPRMRNPDGGGGAAAGGPETRKTPPGGYPPGRGFPSGTPERPGPSSLPPPPGRELPCLFRPSHPARRGHCLWSVRPGASCQRQSGRVGAESRPCQPRAGAGSLAPGSPAAWYGSLPPPPAPTPAFLSFVSSQISR